jgi:hypothetical protein
MSGLLFGRRSARTLLFSAAFMVSAGAQQWDAGSRLLNAISNEQLKFTFESRVRYEDRTENAFGKDPDLFDGLARTRFGVSYRPVKWIRFSGMVQDARAPFYGPNAPNSLRDEADLQEGYFELFPMSKTGFGMTAGRMMMNYGDARLIGSPQWSALSRTYDHARAYYKFRGAQFEFLFLSPVKIRLGEFNRPVLGDRVWGTYNVIPDLVGKNSLDVYILRHDQNRPAGFTGGSTAAGTDRLGINTFGFRLTGPAALGAKYTLEGAVQNGKVGPAGHRAGAWVATLMRRFKVDEKPLDVSGEYKFASGSGNPADTAHSGTFDQLYPANHDKFGHEDLFGWKNLHNARSLATFGLTKAFAVNVMYNSYWLASARDGLYNSAGKVIARSAAGRAGTHVGQEADVFATYKYKHFMLGAGYGHFFAGGFIRTTTPGAGPNYLYLFHTYSL